MKTPHKHADLIKAWADGAEIEIKTEDGRWDAAYPSWQSFFEYRIKPEPKPDVVLYGEVRDNRYGSLTLAQCTGHNVKFTFDGETGALKTAEVLA